MGICVGLACSEDTWAVGHLKDVGHVASSRAVEDGDLMPARFDQVEYGDDEDADTEGLGTEVSG